MNLTNKNYFSKEADIAFMSCSQYHKFVGTDAYPACEAMAMAVLKGEWKEDPSVPMLVGSYVDEYFTGDLEQFKKDTPKMFTQKGELLAPFKKAEEIINIAKEDEFFMKYIAGGESQVIVTGELEGVKWKGKIDQLHKGAAIVDLKVVASIREKVWSDYRKEKLNFIEAYGYVNQGAVYQELYRQMTGEKLPFFIAAITKESSPDKEVIYIPDTLLDYALIQIKEKMAYLKPIKEGKYPPTRCGVCDYCRSTKKLSETINFVDLI